MPKLTNEEITALATRKGVKTIAVENFLGSLQGSKQDNMMNFESDASSYRWNAATQKAIRDGITKHYK